MPCPGTTFPETRARPDSAGVRAVAVAEALRDADTVVLAMMFPDLQSFLAEHAAELEGKLIVDPSNPIRFDDEGQVQRTLPDGVSAGQRNRDALPAGARLVKAFGTLSAEQLAESARRDPRAVLFHAEDDSAAGEAVAALIRDAGFEPVSVGGLDESLRIEALGDLHPFGGLEDHVPTCEDAEKLLG